MLLEQLAQGTKVDVQLVFCKSEDLANLPELLLKREKRATHVLDLFLRQILVVHAPDRLMFHDASDQLHHGQNQAREILLHCIRIDIETVRKGARHLRQIEVGELVVVSAHPVPMRVKE